MHWIDDLNPSELLYSAVVLGVGLLVGIVLATGFRWVLRRRRGDQRLYELVATYTSAPLRLLAPLVTELIALPSAGLPVELAEPVHQALQVAAIVAATWLAMRVLDVGERYVIGRYDANGPNSQAARSVQTRVRVGRNLGVVLVVVLGGSWVLTMFDAVRQLGTSLLASAGLATVVVGFAAQRSLGTLLAGIQIALTEPIRLDDVVVVQGEGGRIEEIGVTYVVVRLWDLRRLVVPITWFLDQPFQNWTRHGAELAGTIDVKLDSGVSIPALRTELAEILSRHADLWDGRTYKVQVTDLDRQVVTVRILVGSADSGRLFDLRCAVREDLLAFLQRRPPEPDGERLGGAPPAA